jgi:hypothetical protein
VNSEVDGPDETTGGTELVSAHRSLLTDASERTQVAKVNVPRVKPDTVGEDANT